MAKARVMVMDRAPAKEPDDDHDAASPHDDGDDVPPVMVTAPDGGGDAALPDDAGDGGAVPAAVRVMAPVTAPGLERMARVQGEEEAPGNLAEAVADSSVAAAPGNLEVVAAGNSEVAVVDSSAAAAVGNWAEGAADSLAAAGVDSLGAAVAGRNAVEEAAAVHNGAAVAVAVSHGNADHLCQKSPGRPARQRLKHPRPHLPRP